MLYLIVCVYNIIFEKFSKLNNIKNNKIVVGKKLKIE